jgi:hypothetical protein
VHHENAKGYLQMRCGCGRHLVWLHKAPSSPNHFREKVAYMIRVVLNRPVAATVTYVRPIRVVLDAQFSGEPSYDVLAATGDALTFTLTIEGAVSMSEDAVNVLHEAGCHDPTLGASNGVHRRCRSWPRRRPAQALWG